MCHKRKYETALAANRKAHRVNHNNLKRHVIGICCHYWCRKCGCWHIGRCCKDIFG